MPSIFKRGSTYSVKIDLPRGPDGKRRTTWRSGFKTKRQAQQAAAELVTNIADGSFVERRTDTLAGYLETWLDFEKRQVTAKSWERYASLLRKQVVPHLGATKLQALTGQQLDGLYSSLLAAGRADGKGALSPRTVHHVHRVLSQSLKQAVRWRLLPRNPAEDARPPKVEAREIEILEPAQIERLIQFARDCDSALYGPIVLAATTGMRRGEVLGLRRQDVDLRAGTLTVNQAIEETREHGLRFKAPKSKRGRRTITLPAVTVAMLKEHMATAARLRLELGLGKDPHDLVFTSALGAPLVPSYFSRCFGQLVRDAGLPPVTFHALRHSHISELLRQGVHVKLVSERAGHANISITLDVYSHVMPSLQDAALDVLNRTYRRASSENDA